MKATCVTVISGQPMVPRVSCLAHWWFWRQHAYITSAILTDSSPHSWRSSRKWHENICPLQPPKPVQVCAVARHFSFKCNGLSLLFNLLSRVYSAVYANTLSLHNGPHSAHNLRWYTPCMLHIWWKCTVCFLWRLPRYVSETLKIKCPVQLVNSSNFTCWCWESAMERVCSTSWCKQAVILSE